jgi:hypothetical protein
LFGKKTKQTPKALKMWMFPMHGGFEFEPAAWACAQKTAELPLEGSRLDAKIEPAMVTFGSEMYALTCRYDAGLLRTDLDRLPANPRLAIACNRRQQAEALGLREVDGRPGAAAAIYKPDTIKLSQIAECPKIEWVFYFGPARTEPGQESILELFGIGGSENRKAPKRIQQVLGRHGLVARVRFQAACSEC